MMRNRYPLLLMVFAGVTGSAADPPEQAATATPKISYGRDANAGSWRASITGKESDDYGFEENGAVSLRVYEGFNTFGPVFGHRRSARAIDVTAQMETCSDGNTRIRALNIGGWLYQVSGDCGDFHRGSDVTVNWGSGATFTTVEPGSHDDRSNDKIIRCDPKTWNCRTVTR